MMNVKSPQELLKFMDSINYGFTDEDNNNYTDEAFEKNVFTKWKLSSPERLLKVKYGHCFDQVELEREWFIKHQYRIRTYYIMFLLPYENPFSTHTFLVYEGNKKYYLFEHSDYYNRGIHEYNSLDELLDNEIKHHINTNLKDNKMTEEEINSLVIYEYTKPEYNIDMLTFINNILDNGTKIRLENN